MNFGEREIDARHVADAEGDGGGVKGFIGKRQRLGIGLDEFGLPAKSALFRALPPDRQHVGVDVGDGGAHAGPARFDHAEGNVAGAAREIEKMKRRARFAAAGVWRRARPSRPGAARRTSDRS